MKIILILFLLAWPVWSQERQILPVDEAKKDASFFAFREKLVAAVKKKDSKFVLGVVDPKIKNGFAGNDGLAEFKKQWKPDDPNSGLWKELLTVLANGGTFDKRRRNSFYAPYLYTGFPEDIDAFDYQAIFGRNVNLRAKPEASAPLVATLSYNIVKVDYNNSVKSSDNDEEYSWLKIETLGGKTGFVKAEFVRSSIGYRAGFEKKNGKWMMVFFLAGD
jgi:hypothetical protein